MKYKPTLVAILGILVAFLALEGTSWAPARRAINPMDAFTKNPQVGKWTWFSPLEGVNYDMNQFEDGTIVALHRPKDLHRLKGLKSGSVTRKGQHGPDYYTIESTETYSTRDQAPEWRTSEAQDNIRISLVQAAYGLWLKRGIKCISRRNATDMLGNTFEICNAAPFRFETPYGKSTSDSRGEDVWIITPPASGKQEPARRGSQPRWGR